MDWDELKPKTLKGVVLGEPLASLSIDDLRARKVAFEAEILRVEDEIKRKQALQSAAQAAFKA